MDQVILYDTDHLGKGGDYYLGGLDLIMSPLKAKSFLWLLTGEVVRDLKHDKNITHICGLKIEEITWQEMGGGASRG